MIFRESCEFISSIYIFPPFVVSRHNFCLDYHSIWWPECRERVEQPLDTMHNIARENVHFWLAIFFSYGAQGTSRGTGPRLAAWGTPAITFYACNLTFQLMLELGPELVPELVPGLGLEPGLGLGPGRRLGRFPDTTSEAWHAEYPRASPRCITARMDAALPADHARPAIMPGTNITRSCSDGHE